MRLLMFIPLALVARLRGIERRTIARLRDAGANTAERAVLLEKGGPVADWVYRRLERAGALQDGGNDRYYLHAGAYDAFRGRRRTRALVVVAILTVAFTVLYFRGVFS